MNIKQFIPKYKQIKSKGFIEITRKGDGKFGNTFEDLLGLIENNLYVSVVLFEYKIIKEVPKTGKIVKILGYCRSSEKNIIDNIIKSKPVHE